MIDKNNPLFLGEFYRILQDSTAMWLNMLDKDARVVMWNRGAEQISGYKAEEVLGRGDIWELLYPDAQYREHVFSMAMEIINQGNELTDFETTIRCRDGGSRIISWNSHDVKDEKNEVVGSLALGRDVTELHAYNQKLKSLTENLELSNRRLYRLSAVDELTHLYNRRSMDNYLEQEWKKQGRGDKSLSLLYIDVDCFKQYNDRYGHQAGDEVLVRIARIFEQHARREGDRAARFGGEEFAVILPGTTVSEAKQIADNIREAVVKQGIRHGNSAVDPMVTVSIGVATSDSDQACSVGWLKREADRALYRAKKRGRNRVEVAATINEGKS